jgi:hypothetical protein
MSAGLWHFDKVMFLVADELQIYNRVAAASADPDLVTMVDTARESLRFRAERERWLKRLRSKLVGWPSTQRWVVKSWHEAADARAFRVLRAVHIMHAVDSRFRADVGRNVAMFSDFHFKGGDEETVRRMATHYVLEEIALNIRLRVYQKIYSEFYMGRTFEMFKRVYAGDYSKSVYDLAGVSEPRHKPTFQFLEWDRMSNRWRDGEEQEKSEVVHLESQRRRSLA